jgi:hypothetical protein
VSTRDPLDFLREEARAERAAVDLSPNVEAVVARVAAAAAHARQRHRLRRRIIAILVGALGAGGGGIAWAVVHHSTPPGPAAVVCYQFADLDSSRIGVAADGSDPVELCRAAWTREFPEWGPPPPMVMCYNPAGAIAVFPGDRATCAALGLTPVDLAYGPGDQKLIDFEESLSSKFHDLGCAPSDRVKTLAENELAAFGFSDWSVKIQSANDAAMPCGSMSIDAASKRITIIPIPDIFTANSGGG